jgi:phosphoglycerol transferase MdoB-like AlkP superfamily enzyme
MNTSLYVPKHGAASQVYGDRLLPSLPRLLRQHGYYTATFHTNDVKFWNRNELYRALGFDEYFDREFFGDEDLVFFGSSDEVLYRNTLKKLKELRASGRPFYTQIISMSAHHPFNIPERKARFPLPERFQGTLVGDYISAQQYADEALGIFIRDLKESGLWDDSVIVIYGDHMGVPIYSLSAYERGLMEDILGREYRPVEMMNIPLMISVPGLAARTVDITGGQVDILPTVANLLGISLDGQIHFGQDLLNTSRNLLPQRYYLPSGSFINDTGVFVPGEGFEDGGFYAFHQVSSGVQAGADKSEYERALRLLDKSDRYLRSLPRLD